MTIFFYFQEFEKTSVKIIRTKRAINQIFTLNFKVANIGIPPN